MPDARLTLEIAAARPGGDAIADVIAHQAARRGRRRLRADMLGWFLFVRVFWLAGARATRFGGLRAPAALRRRGGRRVLLPRVGGSVDEDL